MMISVIHFLSWSLLIQIHMKYDRSTLHGCCLSWISVAKFLSLLLVRGTQLYRSKCDFRGCLPGFSTTVWLTGKVQLVSKTSVVYPPDPDVIPSPVFRGASGLLCLCRERCSESMVEAESCRAGASGAISECSTAPHLGWARLGLYGKNISDFSCT